LAHKNFKDISMITGDPQWYIDAVIYQLHIKAFFDSNDDGIGDIKGLERKLDYLQELGVTALWLLPFYPSPLKDDGYDIADYYRINPQYGTMRDFRSFLKSAHARGMRVITELVINHTSDQHPWFQRSRKARPGTSWRNFYVWRDTPKEFSDARIIFTDFESSNWTWDPEAGAYYWHRFYSHQPDLNFDNPRVKKEILKVLDFWFAMGVDGLRLDAVPYLFEREGTNCENLPETHSFLKELREHVESTFREKMLLAEANQWPEDAVSYFGDGDECHMAFNFPIMPRIFMSMRMEDRFPLIDMVEQTPSIPEKCQWAIFLRNHDELTLEMVSDEERDYMYRVYARDSRARINLGIRRRLAPLLEKNRRKLELINFLLLTLPGTPILYYGDELGMGDNYFLGDRDGVRTPMQWSPDRNAGFSKANPQTLYLPLITDPNYHYEVINVENEERNPSSFLWWMRKSISIRKSFKAFSKGDIRFIPGDNPKVIAFTRNYEEESLLVVANLSRFSQVVRLELEDRTGCIPRELSGGTLFPTVKEEPYILTMGSNGYYVFLLEPEKEDLLQKPDKDIPELTTGSSWRGFLSGEEKKQLEDKIIPFYIKGCRWFGSRSRKIRRVLIDSFSRIKIGKTYIHLCLLKINYLQGSSEFYLLPMSFAQDEKERQLRSEYPEAVIADIELPEAGGVLFDSVYDPLFHNFIDSFLSRKRRLRGTGCEIYSYPCKNYRKISNARDQVSTVLTGQHNDSAVIVGNRLFLKIFRNVEEGINSESEICRYLTEKNFANSPVFGGTIDLVRPNGSSFTLVIAESFCEHEEDMWKYSLGSIEQYFDQMLSEGILPQELVKEPPNLFMGAVDIPGRLKNYIGDFYLEMVALLGARTAEMHSILVSPEKTDPSFKVEPFSKLYQRSIYQNSRGMLKKTFHILREKKELLPEGTQKIAAEVLELEKYILERFRYITTEKIDSARFRIHGNMHLGQVLFTGKDFIFIEFEDEPGKTMGERRLKRSPFMDVAGMVKSFHYAVQTVFSRKVSLRPESEEVLTPWSDIWYYTVSSIYIKSYLEKSRNMIYMPGDSGKTKLLIEHFLIEKAVYDLGQELERDPVHASEALKGLLGMLSKSSLKD